MKLFLSSILLFFSLSFFSQEDVEYEDNATDNQDVYLEEDDNLIDDSDENPVPNIGPLPKEEEGQEEPKEFQNDFEGSSKSDGEYNKNFSPTTDEEEFDEESFLNQGQNNEQENTDVKSLDIITLEDNQNDEEEEQESDGLPDILPKKSYRLNKNVYEKEKEEGALEKMERKNKVIKEKLNQLDQQHPPKQKDTEEARDDKENKKSKKKKSKKRKKEKKKKNEDDK